MSECVSLIFKRPHLLFLKDKIPHQTGEKRRRFTFCCEHNACRRTRSIMHSSGRLRSSLRTQPRFSGRERSCIYRLRVEEEGAIFGAQPFISHLGCENNRMLKFTKTSRLTADVTELRSCSAQGSTPKQHTFPSSPCLPHWFRTYFYP